MDLVASNENIYGENVRHYKYERVGRSCIRETNFGALQMWFSELVGMVFAPLRSIYRHPWA